MNDQEEMNLEEAPMVLADGEEESKVDKFARLGNYRYRKAVERIRLLANLSNRATYEYTDEQVAGMFARLRAEIDKAEAQFAPVENKIEDLF